MNVKYLSIYMESVQIPILFKVPKKDRSFPIFMVALTGLSLLLIKISGEWLAEFLIGKGIL